ncbi:M20/M25/M40 family metallo-hydrolase [Dactylosporangium cerinum]|uniref:M20/M25/M40 family metallo-hydrolase n=1 Tax=Dactylosporangium cerinum TaxID=1434730 RepID=A0ABV9VIN9_9ACTN
MTRILDELRRLVEAESKTNDLPAIVGCARVLSAVGTDILGSVPLSVSTPHGPVLQWRFGSGPARVGLIGHYDTVHPAGSLEHFPFRIDGDRVSGPGTFDMKAGLLTMLHAAGAVRDKDPGGLDGVLLHCGPDEEVGSPSSKALLQEAVDDGMRAALVYEGAAPGGAIYESRRGGLWLKVVLSGRDAHASRAYEGANALHALADYVGRILDLAAPDLGTTVTATEAAAGTAINTAPGLASLTVDIRSATMSEQLRVLEAMTSMESAVPGVMVHVSVIQQVPPLELTQSRPALESIREAVTLSGMQWPGVATGMGISDANHLSLMGVAVVDGMGPVGGEDHSPREWVSASNILDRINLSASCIGVLRKAFS